MKSEQWQRVKEVVANLGFAFDAIAEVLVQSASPQPPSTSFTNR